MSVSTAVYRHVAIAAVLSTSDATAAMESWDAASKSVLARWEAVKGDEVGVDALLVKMGFPALKAGDPLRKDQK